MYKKRNQKVKFKFRWELGAMLAVVALMITLSIVLRLPSTAQKLVTEFNGSSVGLTSDHVYKEVNLSELKNKIKNEEVVYVYFASPNDATSSSEIANINTAATKWKVETVYYLNSDFAFEEDREEDEDFDKEISEIEAELGVSLEYTLGVWVFENGVNTYDSYDFYDEDTETMKLSWTQIADRAFCRNLDKVDE